MSEADVAMGLWLPDRLTCGLVGRVYVARSIHVVSHQDGSLMPCIVTLSVE